jgi:glutaryl-CoA dehydrogenase
MLKLNTAKPDLYLVDELFDDEERILRDTVRDWVESEYMPIIERCYEEGRFPTEMVKPMAEMGLLGTFVPEEYGGGGMSHVCYGLACQELERGDSGLRSFVSVQSSLVQDPLLAFGSEEQKKRWLPPLCSGDAIGCFGLTEPDHGSDPGAMDFHAKRKGGDWVLNGSKAWITNGSIADLAIVWAKDEEGRVRGFIAEKDMPGYTTQDIEKKLSLRASVTSILQFDDVRVPDGNVLPLTDGLTSPLKCLNSARYGISWGALGSALFCFEMATRYASERKAFGKTLDRFQITQTKLVKMLSEITRAQLLVWRLGRLKDEGKDDFVRVSLGKLNNVDMALDVARLAREILGANGISLEYHVVRHMANLESVKTYEGTNDIHTLILGQAITGQDAFR